MLSPPSSGARTPWGAGAPSSKWTTWVRNPAASKTFPYFSTNKSWLGDPMRRYIVGASFVIVSMQR